MKQSLKVPRVLVALGSLMLVGALLLPIWRIELSAPQYPEGLVLKIGANGLSGDVTIVNGLNHYIGMATLHSKDFIEFTLLPYLLAAFIVFGLLSVFINRKGFYYAYIALFIFFAVVSMVDFYRWEYNYGHNLNPEAPIQIPGMSYQPPLIGYKQLLNFGAYSIPDVGGWFFIGTAVLLFIGYLILLQPKWLGFKKRKVAAAFVMLAMLQSCNAQPQPIRYGSDACGFCKMTIMDKRFACEWVTDKSKVYRFDDLHCLLSFRKSDNSKGNAYVNDYTGRKELVKAADLFFATSEALKTPMGGNTAAFTDKAEADEFMKSTAGRSLSWREVTAEMQK